MKIRNNVRQDRKRTPGAKAETKRRREIRREKYAPVTVTR